MKTKNIIRKIGYANNEKQAGQVDQGLEKLDFTHSSF